MDSDGRWGRVQGLIFPRKCRSLLCRGSQRGTQWIRGESVGLQVSTSLSCGVPFGSRLTAGMVRSLHEALWHAVPGWRQVVPLGSIWSGWSGSRGPGILHFLRFDDLRRHWKLFVTQQNLCKRRLPSCFEDNLWAHSCRDIDQGCHFELAQ